MELALGTVQFGLAYGIANDRGKTPEREAKAVLELAFESGIRRLDTAAAYGDIEERLAALCGNLDFSIISKIPAIGTKMSLADAATFLRQSIERSRRRIGDRLVGMLFHDATDLCNDRGRALWDSASECTTRYGLALGSSGYDPQQMLETTALPGFSLGQLPGNALDQRVSQCRFNDVEISIRSAVLQGLLLLPADEAAARVPASAEAIARWDNWCEAHGVSRLVAAFSIVKGFGNANFCVVGVDNVRQLEANIAAWENASSVHAPELAAHDPNCIDPRFWSQRN